MNALKYSFLFLFMISAALASAQNQEARKYNDKIITEQHNIASKMVKFFKSFKTASLDDLKKQRTQLIAQIDKSIAKIQAMGSFENDAKLRDGALELLNFYKSTLEKEYNEMIQLIANRGRSKADNDKLEKYKSDLISREDDMDNKFAKIQEDFAARHKLILQKHEIKQ
jgi:Rad3-related DNA helicase